MKVGIQGLKGSFHHQAAEEFFGSTKIEIVSFDTFDRLYEALSVGGIDRAVAAAENNLYGTVNESFDLMLQYKTAIIGEVYLHVSFELLGVTGSSKEQITDVYSQAPALGECRHYLKRELPWARLHETDDTAMAAKFVADQLDSSAAAIASGAARKIYGLASLEDEIEDHKNNYTRFVILAKDQQIVVEADKTSLIMRTNHTPGALYRALGAFADNGINLSKLESRPIAGKDWNYMFYVGAEAAVTSDQMKKALAMLEEQTAEITILGSYKRGSLPEIH